MSNSTKPKYVSTQYKPRELIAAVEALMNNPYHNFHEGDAKGIVMALCEKGFRIIKTGVPE